ncbi:transcriptional repressor [Microvirga sp. HBU67558]|uniref:Fur family transcriptional regulator n=1 Tax=Microvirga TaxID=186650 RepID=UPI001B3710AE|nr:MULTISPECIES: Fur family transcriptional regulator [unclassified Microvirga]MBQ0821908.1 transcriptional repressor [Microvirga sp. HBU67558]
MTNRIETQCRAHGLRLTGQRRLIAQVLAAATDHPDVYELHRRVSERDPHINLATVYRTMKRLESEGIVERQAFRDGRSRYEGVSKKGHHDHLIDIETGAVVEFRNAEIERLQELVARELGYQLVSHRLELYAVPLANVSSRKN